MLNSLSAFYSRLASGQCLSLLPSPTDPVSRNRGQNLFHIAHTYENQGQRDAVMSACVKVLSVYAKFYVSAKLSGTK